MLSDFSATFVFGITLWAHETIAYKTWSLDQPINYDLIGRAFYIGDNNSNIRL